MRIVIKDKSHIRRAAERFLKEAGNSRIFAFYGRMGAGKTTVIKSICQSLSATDVVTSPTFTLVNEYRTSRGEPIYHIDFYRIKNPAEVFDLGIEEYFDSGYYCFMEWPELIEQYLPPETIRVRITVGGNEERILETE
ncbi:MAG TPA: tRNA (adenosine(37)-N6)-threonylcarbamoyltransferase complex ATPase subunit type 1 TsaE [Bacteroidales bacterium]|nr:tRNA (adenosine(37)-N6)-threonylcarbamoyltransferase complex ATPase subunit type 1 TsaE [Bacteroidales bacterium]